MKRVRWIGVFAWSVAAGAALWAQSPPGAKPDDAFAGLRARSIGPAVTSGRVMTIAVDPANKATFYVGAASNTVIESAGQDAYGAIMAPLSLSLTERCDAVLRIDGLSQGADDEVETFVARGLAVFRSVDEIPGAHAHADHQGR